MAMTLVDPRVVGGRYWSAYWREAYTVEGIDSQGEGGCPWLTVRWDKGGTTVHRTLWDTRDRVLDERPPVTYCPGCPMRALDRICPACH